MWFTGRVSVACGGVLPGAVRGGWVDRGVLGWFQVRVMLFRCAWCSRWAVGR